jgi:hypothetical protein
MGEVVMDETRLRHILAEELEKEEGLPPGAAEHIEKIRTGDLSPGLRAALRAMKRAANEAQTEQTLARKVYG